MYPNFSILLKTSFSFPIFYLVLLIKISTLKSNFKASNFSSKPQPAINAIFALGENDLYK